MINVQRVLSLIDLQQTMLENYVPTVVAKHRLQHNTC